MGDEDVDAKRSRPSIGKPAMCHARKERVLLIGTDQRITSGPAARTAASRGRIHGCTRIVSRKVRFFSLAPRAPSIHDTQETVSAAARGSAYRGAADDIRSRRVRLSMPHGGMIRAGLTSCGWSFAGPFMARSFTAAAFACLSQTRCEA